MLSGRIWYSMQLKELHERPYTEIEGAYVKVQQEVNTNSVALSAQPETHMEVREGEIVGRGNGQGTAYDSGEGCVMPISIGPSIYLNTPEDTILEVRTDKDGNKLTMFEPQE